MLMTKYASEMLLALADINKGLGAGRVSKKWLDIHDHSSQDVRDEAEQRETQYDLREEKRCMSVYQVFAGDITLYGAFSQF